MRRTWLCTAMVLSGYLICYLKQPAAVGCCLLPPCQVNAVLGSITCFCRHVIILSLSDSLRQGDRMENNCRLPVLLPTLSRLLISWALNWASANANPLQKPARQSGWGLPRIVGWPAANGQSLCLFYTGDRQGIPQPPGFWLSCCLILHRPRKKREVELLATGQALYQQVLQL